MTEEYGHILAGDIGGKKTVVTLVHPGRVFRNRGELLRFSLARLRDGLWYWFR